MGLMPLALVLLVSLLAACAGPRQQQDAMASPVVDTHAYREYALARCLAYAYNDAAFGMDADYAAGAYRELGGGRPATAYQTLDGLAMAFADHTARGPRNLALMKCIDLHQSAALSTAIRRIQARERR